MIDNKKLIKKALPIILFILIIAVVSFIIFYQGKQTNEEDVQEFDVMESTSLLGWLKGGGSIECILSSTDGDFTVQSKDSKVRIDGIPYMFVSDTTSPEPGVSLSLGDWVYLWSGNKGTKLNIKSIQQLASEQNKEIGEKEQVSWEEWVKSMEVANTSYECKEKYLSDDIFIPPSDVEFTDWTEWMINMQQLSQDLLQDTKEGDSVNIEDIEKRMQDLNLDEMMKNLGIEE